MAVPLKVRDAISAKALQNVADRRAKEGLKPGEMRCSACGDAKSENQFTVTGRNRQGVRRYKFCKPCANENSRIEKLRNVFNLTLDEHGLILFEQEGRCAICGRQPEEGQNRLSLDHRHADGLLRGLLCWLCNRLLGMLRDDPHRAEKVLDYLRNPPATRALGEPRYCKIGRVTKKRNNRDPFLVKRREKENKMTHGDAISLAKFLKTVAWG